MKHPVLARVFAVVLALLCLLMLLNGISGFGKNEKAQQERTAFEAKYAQRIETYVTLDEQVKTSISYDDAYEEYKALLEQHDKDASQHRTDTALYTAEKGGNTMGANMLWEALPEVESAKRELAAGKKKLADMEKTYEENKGTIATILTSAENGEKACAAENTRLDNVLAGIAPEPEIPDLPSEPKRPIAPEEMTMPEEPELERPEGEPQTACPQKPEDPGEDADEAAKERYREEYAQYQAELAAYEKEWDDYRQAMSAWEQYDREKAAYDAYPEIYPGLIADYEDAQEAYLKQQEAYEDAVKAHSDWEDACKASKAQANFGRTLQVLGAQAGNLAALAPQVMQVANAFGFEDVAAGAGNAGGVDPASMMSLMSLAMADPTAMTNEEFIQNVGLLQGALSAMESGFSAMSGSLGGIEEQIEAGKTQIAAGEKALKEGEAALKSQLENIWYNLDQLDKKADELRDEKEKLDLEALSLDKKLMETDELKAIKNKHISTRQLLIGIPEVKRMYAESGDLIKSAESYLDAYRAETQKLYTGRRILNLLALIGGIAGVLGIPSAFEKIRGRAWLLLPVLICLACALGADAVNMHLGLGQMYTALFTAIFAALQLLILLPKEKVIPAE